MSDRLYLHQAESRHSEKSLQYHMYTREILAKKTQEQTKTKENQKEENIDGTDGNTY